MTLSREMADIQGESKLRPGWIQDESKVLAMSSWEVAGGGVPSAAEEGAARRIFDDNTEYGD